MYRIRFFLFLCPFLGLLIAGCASKSSSIDQLTANQTNRFSARSNVSQYTSLAQQPQLKSIASRLRGGSETDRIDACEQLGRIAAENDGDLNSIDMLVDVMKSDESMDVREAATDAIAQLQAAPINSRVTSMIPDQETTESGERIGFLERLWR